MTCEEIILSAPKKQGLRVYVLDHCDKKALIEKYRRHEGNIENIEEVDFVWDGRSYTELIGRRHIYDWIIGSHVLEHTSDLIGFLNDCDSLLKKDGVLSLAVPDKRYCFDRFRPLSGIGRHRCRAQSAENSFGGNSGRIFSYGSKQRRPDCLGREGKR